MIIRLEQGEKLLAETRRHWFMFLMEVIGVLVVSLVPFVFFITLNLVGIPLGHAAVWPLWLFFAASWWLMLWVLFWMIWTAYYLDVWYVTNRRVIDVEQHWLFSRQVSELRLDKIQDITVEVHGLFAHLLQFGDIHIQTAGRASEFKITSIPNPHALKEIIWEAHSRALAAATPTSV
jgi:uncharacterized membrane protein YdbT with pleckstrin-like domain